MLTFAHVEDVSSAKLSSKSTSLAEILANGVIEGRAWAMIIGNRWRELRKERDLSTKDLATRAGLLPGDLSDIEHGRSMPSMVTFENVAHYLNVPVSILFYDGENPPELLVPPKRKADRTGKQYRKDTQELAGLRILLTHAAK